MSLVKSTLVLAAFLSFTASAAEVGNVRTESEPFSVLAKDLVKPYSLGLNVPAVLAEDETLYSSALEGVWVPSYLASTVRVILHGLVSEDAAPLNVSVYEFSLFHGQDGGRHGFVELKAGESTGRIAH